MKEKHLNVELALFLVLVVCYSVSTIEHPLCTWPWRSRNNKQGKWGQNHHSTVSWGTTGFRSWINNLTVIFYLLSVLRNSTNFKYSVTFFFTLKDGKEKLLRKRFYGVSYRQSDYRSRKNILGREDHARLWNPSSPRGVLNWIMS